MTNQETIDRERLYNLALAYMRLAIDVEANSIKIDNIIEMQCQIIETQTQMMIILARMDERMNAMEARQDRMETRMDRLETRMDRLESRLDKLMYWVVGLLTTIGLALSGILIRGLFFPI